MSHLHKILTEEDESLIPSINSHRIDSHQTLQNSNYESQSATQICERKPVQSPENMIGLITHQIQDEIQKSQITISNEPKPFPLIDSSSASNIVKNESQKYDVNKVAEFVKKRQHLQQEIRRLKLQQEEQRNKSRSQSPLDKTYKNFRSNFTTEEHLQISRIIKKSQQFQNQIQNKEKILAQTLEAENLRQQEEHKIYLKQLKEKKKQEALKKIQKIEQVKMQRIQKIKLQNKQFQSIKNTKALHQKIQEHDKLFEEQKKEKQVQILRQKRQSMTVNFAQIKNHEKKYYETVRMSKEKIQHQVLQKIQKMKEQQILLSQTYRPSKFLLNLWNEEKQKEELQIERIEKLKSLYNRKNHYQEELRIIHKDKIKTKPKVDLKKSIIDNKIQEHQLKVKSMSAADIYRQGQEYMKSVHKSITPNLVEQTKTEILRNYSELKNAPKPQYRDYLQEQKLKKELQYKSTGNLKIRENPEIHELESLIERKKENKMIKLEKAKLIAQKLDKKAKNSTTSALIDSISAKLKIIEEFS